MSSLPSGWEKDYSHEGMVLSELKDLEQDQQTVLISYTNDNYTKTIDVMAERTSSRDEYNVKSGVEYYVRMNDGGPLAYDYSPDNFEEAKQAALDWVEEEAEGMTEEEITNAEDEAYNMGRNEAPDTLEPDQSPEEVYESMKQSYPQSAAWANNIEPRLRALAGFTDSGTGTYTEGDMKNQQILNELVDEFWRGVHDQITEQRGSYQR